MSQATASVNLQAAGLSLTSSVQRTGDHPSGWEIDMAAAKAGTLTTRTDNETGELTMSGGHGITTGSVIDLYWSGGARYGILVGTVSGNAVPIGADNGGTGDNLPADETAITAMVQQTVNGAIDGDNVVIAGLKPEYTTLTSTGKSRVGFFDADNDLIASLELDANSVRLIDVYAGDTNPFTGDPITYMKMSHGDSSNACKMKVAVLQDSTP